MCESGLRIANGRILIYGMPQFGQGCKMIVSFQWKQPMGDKREGINPFVSFLYDAGEFAIEWEVAYGPIQVIRKCDKDHEKAVKHWYYDFVVSASGEWSQQAVDSNNLPLAAQLGNYDVVFGVLKKYAELWGQDNVP